MVFRDPDILGEGIRSESYSDAGDDPPYHKSCRRLLTCDGFIPPSLV